MSEADGEAFTSRIVGNIPMGNMGEPLDIANGVLFLASEESKYMTGSELIIDGGYIAQVGFTPLQSKHNSNQFREIQQHVEKLSGAMGNQVGRG